MTAIDNDAVKPGDDELARLRVENARLRAENARLDRELGEHKRLLWSRSETVTANEIEDFKERQSVWTFMARRAIELTAQFSKSPGTLPKIESMTAMLRHSVSTAAEMNLYHNPDITDAEKEALQEAYAEQLRFVEAMSHLAEPLKQRILEVAEKVVSRFPPHEIEAVVLACYEELTDRQQHERMGMETAQQAIAASLRGRTKKAVEAMVTRARNSIKAVQTYMSGEEHSALDDHAIAGYGAYHRARRQLWRESGDTLTRIHRLLSRLK
jgi:hypothetical protein